MRETYRFVLDAKVIGSELPEHILLPHTDRTVKALLDANDPHMDTVRRIQHDAVKRGDFAIWCWDLVRTYEPGELEAASWFLWEPAHVKSTAGDYVRPVYDDSAACPVCGVGARQTAPLRLQSRDYSSTWDVFSTWAGELIVRVEWAERLTASGLTGVAFRTLDPASAKSRLWCQMLVEEDAYTLAPPTIMSHDPLEERGVENRCCPIGRYAGMRLNSEVHVELRSATAPDFGWTYESIGLRSGLFRPAPAVIVSRRAYEWLRDSGMKDIRFERAFRA